MWCDPDRQRLVDKATEVIRKTSLSFTYEHQCFELGTPGGLATCTCFSFLHCGWLALQFIRMLAWGLATLRRAAQINELPSLVLKSAGIEEEETFECVTKA